MAELKTFLTALGARLGRHGDEQCIRHICKEMKEGQAVNFAREFFDEAFTYGFPTIYNNAREAFLSGMIGSAWGVWRCDQNPMSGDYRVSRHKGDDTRRVYVDPDRTHLFRTMPDGTLEHISHTQSEHSAAHTNKETR